MRKSTGTIRRWKEQEVGGENITIDNCKGGYFSVTDDYGLKVVGKTAQESKTGKNLIPFPYAYISREINGVTYTVNEDGSVLINGTATNNSVFYLYNNKLKPFLELNKTYVLSKNTPNMNNGFNLVCNYYDADGTMQVGGIVNDTQYSKTFIPNDSWVGIGLYLVVLAGNTVSNVLVKPQIELGDVATSYEPYCGGIPSPNPNYPEKIQCVKTGTKVNVCGKNLFDISKLPQIIADKLSVNGNTVTVTKYSNNWVDDFRDIFNSMGIGAGDTITISRKRKLIEGTPSNNIWGRLSLIKYEQATESANLILINGHEESRTITLPDDFDINNYRNLFVYGIADGVVEISDIQFEKSSTATSYHPYISNEITVPCDLYEGDIWYPMSGKVERHNAVIESYSDESVTTDYISATGQLSTGAKVVYCLNEQNTEYYPPQPIFMPQGTVNITQEATDLSATLSATVLRR